MALNSPHLLRGSIIGVASLALLLAAPAPGQSQTPAADAPGETAELVIALEGLGSQTWAPWLAGQENRLTTNLVGDTLTRVDPDTLEIIPGLAESWETTDGGKTWTFKLRPGVPFQDGWGEVTAEDVRFSFEQWLHPDSVQDVPGIALMNAIDNDIANFEVLGPLEFRITGSQPTVILPALLSDTAYSITVQSKAYFEAEPDKALVHPLGTGPYKFVSSTPGVEVLLEAVDSHPFRSVSDFETLRLREIPDAAARLAQVRAGNVDLARLDADLVGEAQAANLKIITTGVVEQCMVVLGGYYLTTPALDGDSPWIQSDNPDKGRAIREAMSLAIDRDTIMQRLLPGFSEPVGAPLLHWPDDPNLTDTAWTPTPYDIELAKEKLAEGGYPDGFDITFRAFEQVPTAEAIADMWGELGLNVTFEVTRQANMRPLFEQSNNPEGNSATNGTAWLWCNPRYPDPTMMFPNAWMTTGFRMQAFSPAIEDAYPKMLSEADPAKRYAIARSIGDVLLEDRHPIPLYGYKYGWAAGPRVGDYMPLPGVNDFGAAETVTKAQN